jgi:nuclear transport factor 2 (NTF2) superfamily protein
LDEQIKEHKASAKVSLALHFDRELAAAEECAKNRDLYEAFVHRIWVEMLNTMLKELEK